MSWSDFVFLARIAVERILLVFVVLVLIFNPYYSLFHIIAQYTAVADLQDHWLFPTLGVLIAAGAHYWFVRTAFSSLKKSGVIFFLILLGLATYIPFYLGWPPTLKHVGYIAYFVDLPILLGMGLWNGYFTRWASGMLITKPVTDQHAHAAHGHAAATHVSAAGQDGHHH